MDPLSIAATVISLVETGLRIKASVDKISHNRQRVKELSEDILGILVSLKDFYHTNEPSLDGAALSHLRRSFDTLTNDLSRVYTRCQRYERGGGKSKLRRLAYGLRSWMDADELEADLVRLRESTQSSLIRVNLLISARNEVAIARLEQAVLVRPSEAHLQVRQLDNLMGQGIYSRDAKLLSLGVFHSTHIDDLDRQYIQLKSRDIAAVLQTRPSAISIALDSYSYMSQHEYIVVSVEEPSPEMFIEILKSLSDVWRTLHTTGKEVTSQCSLFSVLKLANSMSVFQCYDIALAIYDIVEGILRHFLDSRDSRHDEDNLLAWLAMILRRRIRLAHYCSTVVEETKYALEVVQIRRRQLGYFNPRSTPTSRRLRLNRAFQRLVIFSLNSGDYESGLVTCTESLEMLGRDAALLSSGELQDDYDAEMWCCASQAYANTLYLFARALELNGEYTRAFYAGKDSIDAIQRMKKVSRLIGAPEDFDFLEDEVAFLEARMPAWTSIGREPCTAQIEAYDDWQGDDDDDVSQLAVAIQWGIAC